MNSKKTLLFLPFVAILSAIAASVPPLNDVASADQMIIATGSSTVAPLVAEMVQSFEQQHPGVRINVETGGSSRGVADALRGLVDFGMVSRSLKPEEHELRAYTIAWDGIAIIVHSSNPISDLTEEQVRKIFRGEIANWSALGGPDKQIVVINKAQGRSTLELFLEHFGLKAEEVRASTVIGDNQQGIKLVAGNSAAIGYVSVGAAEYAEAQGTSLRSLPLRGVASTRANVQNGSYPLRRPLNLVIRGEPANPHVQAFIDFALSARSDQIIEELYFVPPIR